VAHKRKQIRDALVTAVTGLATTGTNVTAGVTYPTDEGALPTVDVMTPEEEYGPSPMGASRDAILTATITATARGTTYLDTLDQIALEVETAVAADKTLGGIVSNLDLVATVTVPAEPGEERVGQLTMDWRIVYISDETDPQ
jgi:hypothetical protein